MLAVGFQELVQDSDPEESEREDRARRIEKEILECMESALRDAPRRSATLRDLLGAFG